MSDSAGFCARCGGVIPPMDRVAGTDRGHCPDCDREVRVLASPPVRQRVMSPVKEPVKEPAQPRRMIPVFRPPPPAPPSVELTRVGAPADVAPVDQGPFRTAGRGFTTRRGGGSLTITIASPENNRTIAVVLLAASIALMALLGPSDLTVEALAGGCVAVVLAEVQRRSRPRLELTPTEAIARSDTLPRGRITHVHCLREPGAALARVEATVGRERTTLIWAPLDDAEAIAALLAHELGLPTWVPALDDGGAT